MPGFLGAHGYEPGPTQRPLLAGVISGALSTIPAIAILHAFGSLAVEANILGFPRLMTVVTGLPIMAAAGAAYGRLFGRAANDRRGGWLFGMAFGFALWAAGAVLVIPLASNGLAPAGKPAIGLFLSLVMWGATLGIAYPLVHRPLHERLETAARRIGPHMGAPRVRTADRTVRPPAQP
ncbi:MAG: hypothetical protein HOP91_06975 [Sphingomonas sp.]|nr:hypothetical protein [Sphingomonas sp.]